MFIFKTSLSGITVSFSLFFSLLLFVIESFPCSLFFFLSLDDHHLPLFALHRKSSVFTSFMSVGFIVRAGFTWDFCVCIYREMCLHVFCRRVCAYVSLDFSRSLGFNRKVSEAEPCGRAAPAILL